MASRLEQDLRCPVCQEIYKHPVVLSCTHSFCKDCLKNWWRKKLSRECPVCRTVCLRGKPPVSLVLKNLCEAYLLERASESLCSLHSEELKLFCLDHQQPVCLVCRDSEKHANHRFRPIEEAAPQHKKLQDTLKSLKEKLNVSEEVKLEFERTAEHIQRQLLSTERQIKEQFKKFHLFLDEEEEARISALREEEKQKSQVMKKKIEALSKDIAVLSDTIRTTEEELRAEDVSFLQNYEAAVRRFQQRPLLEDPQLVSGALIDQAKHLGNLSYNIWNKMKHMVSYTPVVLDPNTAFPELLLSESLTALKKVEEQQLPDNPERFDTSFYVVGSEGFNSGTHRWDVEVGDSPGWSVGVLAESVQRKGLVKSGFWVLMFHKGKYKARSGQGNITDIPVENLWRVRVELDCDRGRLAFSDPDTNTHLHTFRRYFTERMFPFIIGDSSEKILPCEICVTVEQSRYR